MAENNTPKYVVAVTQVVTYVYVDIATGEVELVVADDTSLPSYDDMAYRYADDNCTPLDHLDVDPNDVEQAKAAMNSQAWPAWEFSW
jgi:hypothetical protein